MIDFEQLRCQDKATVYTSESMTISQGENLVHKIQCLHCRKFFLEEENTRSSCRYHNGCYREVFTSHIVSGAFIKKWSCCNSDLNSAEGCIHGFHLEDKKSSSILSRFEVYANSQTSVTTPTNPFAIPPNQIAPSSLIANISLPSDVEVETDQYKLFKNGSVYFKYRILLTDTLVGVALKFGLKLETIKSINSIQNDSEIYSRYFLYLPWAKDKPFLDQADTLSSEREAMKKHTVSKFMRLHALLEDEALCYLSENDFDVDKAAQALQDDVDWEHSQPVRHRNTWSGSSWK